MVPFVPGTDMDSRQLCSLAHLWSTAMCPWAGEIASQRASASVSFGELYGVLQRNSTSFEGSWGTIARAVGSEECGRMSEQAY